MHSITDLYVALSDAPEGVEHQFKTVQPAAYRRGAGLVMFFERPDTDADICELAEEVDAVLAGCDFFWAVLQDGELLESGGDYEHTFAVPLGANHLLH